MSMEQEVLNWLRLGDTGLSSKAIAFAGCGTSKPKHGWAPPYDPSDFGRCARLLKAIPDLKQPAFERLARDGGDVWKSLIKHWDEIHSTMEDEVGIDWSKGDTAKKTNDLIKSITEAA